MSRPAIHPGEILADELEELGITPTELSRQLRAPPNRIDLRMAETEVGAEIKRLPTRSAA